MLLKDFLEFVSQKLRVRFDFVIQLLQENIAADGALSRNRASTIDPAAGFAHYEPWIRHLN